MGEYIDMSVATQGKACDLVIVQCFALCLNTIQGSLHKNDESQPHLPGSSANREGLALLRMNVGDIILVKNSIGMTVPPFIKFWKMEKALNVMQSVFFKTTH